VLLMVHNPRRVTAGAVGFLYWFRRDDLRMQGAVFDGGFSPRIRVWWTSHSGAPYEWGVIEGGRNPGKTLRFSLFRLSEDGSYWDLGQYEERDPVLSGASEAVWADPNRDGIPEIVSWTTAATDSLFIPCSDCPRLLTENTFVERREGFTLFESRLVPGPYATLVLFVRLLLDHNRTAAARLLADPARVTEAVALGWGVKRAPGTWTVEYGESGEPWPRWLELRFDGPQGVKRYIVHFALRPDGHWVIRDFIEPKAAPTKARAGTPKP